jgi:Porin subfamily
MRRIILALTIAALSVWAAGAQQSNPQPKKPPNSDTASKSKACPEYGPGFVKLPGSDTCVKIGGSVEAGGSMRH